LLNYAYGNRAPTRTIVNLATVPVIVKASGTVYIYGIAVKSTLDRTITFQDKDSNAYMTIRAGISGAPSVPIPILWVADNGLQITADSISINTEVTVFHSSLVGS